MKNSKASAERYSRQLVLKEIGAKGQLKLSKACVAVVGCGALGTNTADSLVRAGVGRVILLDRDLVEYSNLQRQSVFSEEDAGQPKAWAVEQRLEKVNSDVKIDSVIDDLNSSNMQVHLKEADLVLDCTDNMETRKALNEYCLKARKPWIYAAVVQTYGYVMPVLPGKTACLKCLLKKNPRTCDLPACGTHGVLNTAAKLVSAIQATQALKFIVTGEFDEGLFYSDAWNNKSDRLTVARNEECEACG